MSNKPYKDRVSLEEIMHDGWSRGFNPEQTLAEARDMGFTITPDLLSITWEEHQLDFDLNMSTGEDVSFLRVVDIKKRRLMFNETGLDLGMSERFINIKAREMC